MVYSEERARKEEASHQGAMERFGEHLLKIFQKELEKQRQLAWERYKESTRYLGMIGTEECFRTEAAVDRGLANLSKTQARDMIKDNFKCWEEGAGWNKLFAPDTEEYSKDGSIQKLGMAHF